MPETVSYTRGFHPRRRPRLTQVRRRARSGCTNEGALEDARMTARAQRIIEFLGMDQLEVGVFVQQHLNRCRRWREGHSLKTPFLDEQTHQTVLWATSICQGGRLYTVVSVPGEEPF